MLIAREAEHLQRQQFDGAQHFGAAFQEQSRVGTGKFNQDLGAFPVSLFGKWRIDGDAVFQAQAAMGDDALQEFIDLVGGGDFVGNGHKEALSYQPSALSSCLLRLTFASILNGSFASRCHSSC